MEECFVSKIPWHWLDTRESQIMSSRFDWDISNMYLLPCRGISICGQRHLPLLAAASPPSSKPPRDWRHPGLYITQGDVERRKRESPYS